MTEVLLAITSLVNTTAIGVLFYRLGKGDRRA